MADNFNLRTFLAENKLTKNAKLLKEEEDNLGQPQRKVDYKTLEVDGVDGSDYPDFADAYLSYGEYEDGTPLTDDELQELDPDGAIAQEMASEEYTEGGDDYEDPDDFDENTMPNKESGKKSEEDLRDDDFILFPLDKSNTKYVQGGKWREKRKPDNTVNENKMTSREKYLTRLVENALGLEGHGDDNVFNKLEKRGDEPVQQAPTYSEGEEMVQKEPLPKYENIEKLMKEIEEGTNKAMYEYKMKRMMEIAEMLEAKVSSLEEGEHAEYTDKKAINQIRKDIAALRKGEEKLRKEFDKKFNKKEKGAAPKKEAEAEKPTLQEGTFDLKKFLVENKMTANSKLTQE
tara:strand:- start:1367 stop:2404 length:1038 start_codon:yes stop_codon:yes gene_type:complete